MANILDDICDDGPVLSPRLSRPKGITKRQVQRCIHELSPQWDDEQLEAVVSMFKPRGLLEESLAKPSWGNAMLYKQPSNIDKDDSGKYAGESIHAVKQDHALIKL